MDQCCLLLSAEQLGKCRLDGEFVDVVQSLGGFLNLKTRTYLTSVGLTDYFLMTKLIDLVLESSFDQNSKSKSQIMTHSWLRGAIL